MPIYQFAWATGHDIALASLNNVESDLAPYIQGRRLSAPRSQPVVTYSEESESLDNWITQDGASSATWEFDLLPRAAIDYIKTTYMGTNESAEITIYTRQQDDDTYTRYNAYIAPFRFPEDGDYSRGFFRNVLIRFTGLEAL